MLFYSINSDRHQRSLIQLAQSYFPGLISSSTSDISDSLKYSLPFNKTMHSLLLSIISDNKIKYSYEIDPCCFNKYKDIKI